MTDRDMREGCELALKYDTASVCIKPYAVPLAAEILMGSSVKTGTVIGFPHGNSSTVLKMAEAEQACRDRAVEIDMVINIGKALGEDWEYVSDEIEMLVRIVKDAGAILKVIFENDYLTDHHIIRLCEICSELKVDFVKTSSGYGFVKQENGFYSYKGATLHQLKLMRRYSDPSVQLKAAGGIRTLEDLLKVRRIGVSRVGATATAVMLDRARELIEKGVDLENYALEQE
jgi:deoxyribose-phosphate aldolase